MNIQDFDVSKFLKANVKPAMGCTEPIAVALAASWAYNTIYGKLPKKNTTAEVPSPETDRVKEITIQTDRDVFKNAYAACIPCTGGKKGMKIAAAIGLYCKPSNKLDLLKEACSNPSVVSAANTLLEEDKVKILPCSDAATLDIRVHLEYVTEEKGIKKVDVRLQREHTNVTYIAVDGVIKYETEKQEFPEKISDFLKIVENLTDKEKKEICEGIKINKVIVKEGLEQPYGLNSAGTLQKLVKEGVIQKDLIIEARIQAAAAGDARMGGAKKSVMSTAGSGNQGITASIPIIVVDEEYGPNKDKLTKALMLSHLVTKYASNYLGYLSPLCGCSVKAGIGASAAVTYYLGGNNEQINNAINIMAANITGIICDGAKEGCALKLSTAAGTAVESALMAIRGMKVPSDNGIIADRAEDTIKNIGKVSKAMGLTNLTIMNIIQEKKS